MKNPSKTPKIFRLVNLSARQLGDIFRKFFVRRYVGYTPVVRTDQLFNQFLIYANDLIEF